jgi:hypothetical protein
MPGVQNPRCWPGTGTKEGVERAFQFAYRSIKPSDGVIVGMFPVLHDEVTEDAGFARTYGAKC